MARPKSSVRLSTVWSGPVWRRNRFHSVPRACYDNYSKNPHLPPVSYYRRGNYRYALRDVRKWWPIRAPVKSRTKSKRNGYSSAFRFTLLPKEVQDMIWEFAAQQPRIVSVRVSREHGPAKIRNLISSAPAILHICSRSRAIGLKYTHLSLNSQPTPTWTKAGGLKKLYPSTPKVFFNFAIDTLWFGPYWNQDVDGQSCCINYLTNWVDGDDLKRVKSMGFDLSSRNCSTRVSGGNRVYFVGLKGLEKIYLGLNPDPVSGEQLIELRGLEGEEEAKKKWMEAYGQNWRKWSEYPFDRTAEVGCWEKTWLAENGQIENSWEEFEPVMVVPL